MYVFNFNHLMEIKNIKEISGFHFFDFFALTTKLLDGIKICQKFLVKKPKFV